ncbi:hypothetical protein U4960_05715 [Altererythrobacter sp. H2]|uniref:hypothetical protein n=1 Tax=Altererythrobacter sp. H2 TaxID=3108391 RepID=UPI002B4BB88D|nr:hypothetical protein [Altererythrobacter sp. H2]WRK96815.1 hypothetical protein U4960_05715 [Altererythrobacter sp. H2]
MKVCPLTRFASLPLLALVLAVPAVAQDAVDDVEGAIVVRADRIPGQVNVDVAPVDTLDAEDIQAIGATSIADLLTAISPQTGSARGRGGGGQPVFLVNGIRIGSPREFRSYPPEAIAKVEVFPEEVAQRFGFPADRRVVNFVLKNNFASREVEFEYEQPDRGGYSRTEQEFSMLRIADGGRLNLSLEFSDVSLLSEGERGVIQPEVPVAPLPGDPDPADYRSLVPDTAEIQASANWAKSFIDTGSSVSLNANYQRNRSRSLSGLDTVILTDPDGASVLRSLNRADPLERRSQTDTFASAGSYTRPVGDFQLTGTFDASLGKTRTEIERRASTSRLVADAAAGRLAIDTRFLNTDDAGFDIANSKVINATSLFTARGTPVFLPAGDLSTTFDFGYDWTRIDSDDTRSGTAARLTRGDLSGGVNVVVPVTSRREGFLDAIGDVSLSGQAGFNRLSDFGTLYDWSGGVNWSPLEGVDLQATYTWREVAPGLTQLGNPIITDFNVPVFDLTRGETVLASVTTGGNPALLAETQKDWKFSANLEVPFIEGAQLQVDYIRNRSDNVTSSFPLLTPAIEAAFAGRVTRGTDGTLLAIDRRPVTFAETRAERLAFGLTMRGSFGEAQPQGEGGPPRGGPPPGMGGAPSDEQRQRFTAFRERLCAADGEDYMVSLAAAIDRGETPPDAPEGFDAEQAKRMLDRFRAEDGSIDRARLAQFRSMMCSSDGAPMAAAGGQPAAGGPPRGRGGRGGMGGFGPGGDNRGRYFVTLTHTIELNNTVLIAPGVPVLDQLDGEGLAANGFPRHSSRLEGGVFRNGWGVRASGVYTGKARVNGSGLPGSTDLFFDDLATLDLRLFADLGRLTKTEKGFLKGFSVSLIANNVLDGQRRVTDSNGDTPLAFQPFLVDPVGRYLGIDLRKMF